MCHLCCRVPSVCGMHALMHEHTIANIWDAISPGCRNEPLSLSGLSILWKSLFNLFLLVFHKNTSSFLLYIHFRADLFDEWYIELVVSYLINMNAFIYDSPYDSECFISTSLSRVLVNLISRNWLESLKELKRNAFCSLLLILLVGATLKHLFTSYNSNSLQLNDSYSKFTSLLRQLCLFLLLL